MFNVYVKPQEFCGKWPSTNGRNAKWQSQWRRTLWCNWGPRLAAWHSPCSRFRGRNCWKWSQKLFFFCRETQRSSGLEKKKIAPILMSWLGVHGGCSSNNPCIGKIAILKSSNSSFRANITLGGISIAVKTVSRLRNMLDWRSCNPRDCNPLPTQKLLQRFLRISWFKMMIENVWIKSLSHFPQWLGELG